MKRLAFGAAAVCGAAFALHRLAPKVREMHAHCREIMRTHCANPESELAPPRRHAALSSHFKSGVEISSRGMTCV